MADKLVPRDYKILMPAQINGEMSGDHARIFYPDTTGKLESPKAAANGDPRMAIGAKAPTYCK